jgi:predicted nucleic acid-binding protein
MAWVDAKIVSRQNPPKPQEIQQAEDYVQRRAKPRFFADENFPAVATAVLRSMGAKVRTAQEARRCRHPDENHAAYALKHGLALVSCDRDFLNERRFPLIHCPAIFVFDFGNGTVEEIRGAYRCLMNIFYVPQFYDKWVKVDAHRDGWTEYCRFLNGTTSRSRFRLTRHGIQEWVA